MRKQSTQKIIKATKKDVSEAVRKSCWLSEDVHFDLKRLSVISGDTIIDMLDRVMRTWIKKQK